MSPWTGLQHIEAQNKLQDIFCQDRPVHLDLGFAYLLLYRNTILTPSMIAVLGRQQKTEHLWPEASIKFWHLKVFPVTHRTGPAITRIRNAKGKSARWLYLLLVCFVAQTCTFKPASSVGDFPPAAVPQDQNQTTLEHQGVSCAFLKALLKG